MNVTIRASVHDHTQVELNLNYYSSVPPLPDHSGDPFDIDFYFFIPNSFGINSGSYSRDQFYNDLTNHIRLRPPGTGAPPLFLLQGLQEYFCPHTLTSRKSELVPRICQQIRMFGNRINTEL